MFLSGAFYPRGIGKPAVAVVIRREIIVSSSQHTAGRTYGIPLPSRGAVFGFIRGVFKILKGYFLLFVYGLMKGVRL